MEKIEERKKRRQVPLRPERPMKRCPDGSRRPTYAPCPPRTKKSIPREMSRSEQFKRERLGK
jgi:hypothetical protein